MQKPILIFLITVVIVGGVFLWQTSARNMAYEQFTEVETGFEEVVDLNLNELSEEELRTLVEQSLQEIPFESGGRIRWSLYWREFSQAEERLYAGARREPGPIKVGIQIGHWKNDEVPEELKGLERNGSGAVGGGTNELKTVMIIAEKVKALLEAEGIVSELLPATIPVDYFADAFISIHADGSNSSSVSGFKIAGPRTDFSGRSNPLVEKLYEAYEDETGLPRDGNITRRMSGYYAFNWRRYDHALHPMTPAAIVETGFLTSPNDRRIIVSDPDRAARGIANGILNFFKENPVE